jgi:hypothetical protein
VASSVTSSEGVPTSGGLPEDRPGIDGITYYDLWQAVNDLSRTWADLPVVQRFAAALPRNASQRSTGIPGRLQEMEASGAQISAQPLRLSIPLRMMQHMPSLQTQPSPQEWKAWPELAVRIEAVHWLAVAWLRSRVPGYPNLPAPHLARGTPLTTIEFTDQLIWTREERGPRTAVAESSSPDRSGIAGLGAAAPSAR